MAIRTIREIGDPVLNKTCKEVREVTNRTRTLVDDMFETMYEAEGYVHVVGPAPAPVSKIRDYYRYMIYLKDLKEDAIMQAKEHLERLLEGFELKTESVIFDYV